MPPARGSAQCETTAACRIEIGRTFSLPLSCAFDDRDVAVDWQIGKSLYRAAGLRPLHFERINFGALAQSQQHARIVRGHETAPAGLHPAPREVASFVGHARADRVSIGFSPDQFHT